VEVRVRDIVVRGAREHNLAGFDLALPGSGLTVVTGVSGSGKSSLVFDTLHAEARRRYVEALELAASGLRRPAVDAIEGLPPTIALRQSERSPGPHETVASASQVGDLLAVVWARGGVQHDPDTGEALRPTPHDRIVRELLELPDGARLMIEAPLLPEPGADLHALLDEVRRAGFSRIRLGGEVWRIDDVSRTAGLDPGVRVVVDRIRVGADRRPRLAEALRLAGAVGRGIIVAHLDDGERTYVDRPFNPTTRRTFPDLRPGAFSWRGIGRCPACDGAGRIDGHECAACSGARLREASRHVRWRGATLPELLAAPLSHARAAIDAREPDPAVELALSDARARLDRMLALALGHLPLGRRVAELSKSEAQRLRLARAVGQGLTGVLYLLDEPSAGLAPALAHAVVAVLRDLVGSGSPVIVVSHRLDEVLAADRVIELGPAGGTAGGRIVFDGPPSALRGAPTASGRWLAGELSVARPAPRATGRAVAGPLAPAGLGPVVLPIALRGLTVVGGPPASGGSRLVEALELEVARDRSLGATGVIDRVLRVESARAGATRSLVATFVGLWDVVRELLAATTEASIRGLTASHFSLATAGGRCEACAGQGEVKVDLGLLPPAWVRCEVCDGRRFQEDVLDIVWKGHSAARLLDLPADEAWRLLAGHPRLERALRALVDVGLGHVPLGQPTGTLSGGEAARLRLARELARSARGVEGALILVDGPTDGLHPVDGAAIIELLARLCEQGATVVAATHDPAVAEAASLRVTLGPDGQPVDELWAERGATVE
jgi:excinuclease ABC subunit A